MRWSAPLLVAVAALALGIFGVPMQLLPGWSLVTQGVAILEVALLALLASSLSFLWLRLLVWWTIVSFATHYNGLACTEAWRVLIGALVIDLMARHFTQTDINRLLTVWRWLTVGHTSYMLLQLAGYDWFFGDLQTHAHLKVLVTGFMDIMPTAGAYTSMTLPLFLRGRWRWWILPSLLAIGATFSVGAVVIALILLTLMAAWHWKLSMRQIGIGLGALALLSPIPLLWKFWSERAFRFVVWKMTIRLWSFKWYTALFGWGAGQYQPAFQGITERWPNGEFPKYLVWGMAHNEYLQWLFELGSVGLLLAVICLMRWMKRPAEQPVIWLIALGWLLCAAEYYPAHVAPLGIVGMVCAGGLEWSRTRRPVESRAVGMDSLLHPWRLWKDSLSEVFA